jgi:hypothetical protein
VVPDQLASVSVVEKTSFSEAECACLVELADGEIVELRVHVRPVELAVGAFVEAIEAAEDE